jgi:glycosyltransferase involved in cell wall biosynthesis
MYPSISIITPSYNQGNFLEENIRSVIDQKYPNIEHIIIDGGSKDNSTEIIEKYKQHFAYAISEKDKGQSDAVNKGFEKSTGEIIGWLNSDDYLAPGALEAVRIAFADPSVNVVAGYSIDFFEGSNKQIISLPTIVKDQDLAYHLRFANINQPATFFRRDAFASMMPVNLTLYYGMDREMWIKYLLKYGIARAKRIEDRLVYFRYHNNSKSISADEGVDTTYATILYHFSLFYKRPEIADLLSKRYSIIATYLPPFEKYPDWETVLNMIRAFTIKRGALVFTKEQFDFAKKAYTAFDIKNYPFLPQEKKAMQRIQKIARCVNWTHYKVNRKLNLV